MIISYLLVIRRTWANFNQLLEAIPDHRSRHTYQVAEIIMGGLTMFLFQRESRNQADKMVRDNFADNYHTVFGLRLPLMETVEEFLRKLPDGELEQLKQALVKTLIRRKTLDRWRFNGRFIVSVDGTGPYSFDYEPFEGCPFKVSSSGKITWTAYVVEAKLCCGNGFSISLASEWLDSSENMDEKQDCEQKAFVRLARKLNAQYPRLPVIIVADGLYPNQTNIQTCMDHGWNYIFVFKDGSLPSVWEEINSLLLIASTMSNKQERTDRIGKHWVIETAMFINNILYKEKYSLNWIEYVAEQDDGKQNRFVHITDIPVTQKNVWEVSRHGRMRWKIENKGFNTQKNSGLNLQHKPVCRQGRYARKHLWSMKNFYHLLQIAHMMIQLMQKLKTIAHMLEESGMTSKAAMEDMVRTMIKQVIDKVYRNRALETVKQLRY